MEHPATSVRASSPRASRTLAAFLSFVAPGTGQLLTGRIRAGLLFLAPLVVTIAALVALWGADRGELVALVLQPGVLAALVILDVAFLVWRAAAIVDAWWSGSASAQRTRLGTVTVVLLVAVTVGTHAAIGATVLEARDTVEAVFATSEDVDDGFAMLPGEADEEAFLETDEPSATPTTTPTVRPSSSAATGVAASASPTPTATPTATPTPRPTRAPTPLDDGRLDVLLVGGDAGPGRWSLRTDTLMVLSVDVASGEAALFSIPRNMVNVPLPKESRGSFGCRCYPRMINSLYVYASQHPGQFPGKDSIRGLRALQLAIGTLIGRKLDGMVLVELQGFVKLINAVGGLDITVPESVYDRRYPLENGRGYVEVYIRKGKQHMSGRRALMYARSRHQDSDYGRMERQQIVLTALGRQLQKGEMLVQLPDLMRIAKKHLWTNVKRRDLLALVQLAERTDIKGMDRIRFVPPAYPEYLSKASIKRIRRVVAHVFDDAVPRATPAPAASQPVR